MTRLEKTGSAAAVVNLGAVVVAPSPRSPSDPEVPGETTGLSPSPIHGLRIPLWGTRVTHCVDIRASAFPPRPPSASLLCVQPAAPLHPPLVWQSDV